MLRTRYAAIIAALLLTGCGSSDDEDTQGYIKFYNASPNSPAIFLTIDEDLENDPEDEIEVTFTGINYGRALPTRAVEPENFFYELGWQDEDSSARNDLEVVAEGQVQVNADQISLLVMHGDIQAPEVQAYNIPIEDDEDDVSNDLFSLRFLNVATQDRPLDIYMSKSDETFNEANLMGSLSYLALSDNTKLPEDQYIFYITEAGGTDILFQSTEVNYPFSNQYIIVVRTEPGAVGDLFVIDNVGNNSTTTYQASDAQSRFRLFNAISTTDLLPGYDGTIKAVFDGLNGDAIDPVEALAVGEFSSTRIIENGDFSVNIVNAQTNEDLLNRQLVSLEENTDKTIFYFSTEVPVDEDGDGNFDEDEDGVIDQKEIKIQSVVVENSNRNRIFDHEVEILNLAYSEDFERVVFYFVRNDESIATTENSRSTAIGTPTSLVLTNNTYDVFAIANVEGTETVLDSMVLTLNEDSDELYMLFQVNDAMPSGFEISVVDQVVEETTN